MRRLLLCLLLLVLASPALAAPASTTLKGETSWSGRKSIETSIVVPKGASLTIAPGTELRFAGKASLTVEGHLNAVGSAEQPIRFLPAGEGAAASWPGITIRNADKPCELKHVEIVGAATALSVVSSKVQIAASELQGGDKGIALAVDADVTIDQVHLRGMREGGIDASVRARATISGCRIESLGEKAYGIQVSKQAMALIRNNHISHVTFGMLLNGDFPPLEGNQLDHCEVAIGLIQAGPGSVVRGNRVSDSGTGIGCRQFCSPVIEKNQVEKCKAGIECYQGSSPTIRQNRLVDNQRGLSCVQMCNPQVTGNQFAANQSGIYLQLSSYAKIHQNNFERNQLAIELDNMSYDWEQRATHKPTRNLQAQNAKLVKEGRARPKKIKVEVESEGYVDATGNYWGQQTTREMETKGPDANIEAISDGYDVPVLTYKGWDGEYKKDKVKYADWLQQPVSVP